MVLPITRSELIKEPLEELRMQIRNYSSLRENYRSYTSLVLEVIDLDYKEVFIVFHKEHTIITLNSY